MPCVLRRSKTFCFASDAEAASMDQTWYLTRYVGIDGKEEEVKERRTAPQPRQRRHAAAQRSRWRRDEWRAFDLDRENGVLASGGCEQGVGNTHKKQHTEQWGGSDLPARLQRDGPGDLRSRAAARRSGARVQGGGPAHFPGTDQPERFGLEGRASGVARSELNNERLENGQGRDRSIAEGEPLHPSRCWWGTYRNTHKASTVTPSGTPWKHLGNSGDSFASALRSRTNVASPTSS